MPRKTDEEIRARIAQAQRDIDEELDNGLVGGEDWAEAVTTKQTLEWVMGVK